MPPSASLLRRRPGVSLADELAGLLDTRPSTELDEELYDDGDEDGAGSRCGDQSDRDRRFTKPLHDSRGARLCENQTVSRVHVSSMA